MPEYIIGGVTVTFPFEPYDVQRRYMEKVIETLDKSANCVLESPTGTGKTLSLLCSTLGWVQSMKRQVQYSMDEQLNKVSLFNKDFGIDTNPTLRRQLVGSLVDSLNSVSGPASTNAMLGVPKVIYASRTHSQISQAMQELKRTSYNNVKSAVIGSRDQLCIHPDLTKESNANKIQLCKIKLTNRSCHFHNRLETQKDNPEFRQNQVLDIEELTRIGKKLKCCPYYASKELLDDAEIIFMPYNYLLDPKMRKANKIDLQNTIVILDEAHNVEKMCEESASTIITSTQIALAIEDVTQVLSKMVNCDGSLIQNSSGMENNEVSDFSVDDLTLLKDIFLSFEKAIDDIKLPTLMNGETFTGGFIFTLLEKANITLKNVEIIIRLLDTIITYITTDAEANSSVFRRGSGLQHMQEFLQIVFSSSTEDLLPRMDRCYKVYIEQEPQKQTHSSKTNDGWIQSKTLIKTKSVAKILSFWCFSPGFGMQHLLGRNVRSIILTSGTLAPLKPLISELDIPITVQLENPHIIESNQVCVKIIGNGSDKVVLNSNFQNRNNKDYIMSLGRTISALCPIIPGGLLIFFPSYSIMNKCKTTWQDEGVWSLIDQKKKIFVEPQTKEAFVNTMNEYYAKINETNSRGATFMAVCRGKVSEGLDFADARGRAVIITGLPYPPFKDPKVMLKKKYLDENRTRENEMLSGNDWYYLEASRAVNQAIGRVIRHKNDFGAILLCDTRFHNTKQKNQLSRWIQGHLGNQNQSQSFGSVIGELARFFRSAMNTHELMPLKPLRTENTLDCQSNSEVGNKYRSIAKPMEADILQGKSLYLPIQANDAICMDTYKSSVVSTNSERNLDLFSGLNQTVKSINFNNVTGVTIHKRNREINNDLIPNDHLDLASNGRHDFENPKKKKYKIIPNDFLSPTPQFDSNVSAGSLLTNTIEKIEDELPKDRKDLLKFVKNTLSQEKYSQYLQTFISYNNSSNYEPFRDNLFEIFNEKQWFFILKGMIRFTRSIHRAEFQRDVEKFVQTHCQNPKSCRHHSEL